jgi:hypothetical protein
LRWKTLFQEESELATAAVAISKTSPDRVTEFRSRHGLTAEAMDQLFGYSSKGRVTRLWESNGAPSYVGVMMAYMDKHGTKLAEEIAKKARRPS